MAEESPEELAQYVGGYDLGLTVVEVGSADGRLWADVTVPGLEGRLLFLYQGNDVFQAESDPDVTVEFQMTDAGVADGFVLYRKGLTLRATRVRPVSDAND